MKESKVKIRNSGVELLKIIAMFLLVINHVVNTLNWGDVHFQYRDFVVDTAVASTDLSYIILTAFRYLGPLGNTVFFVSSAWYLLDSTKYNKRKWFNMLFEVWVISVIILIVVTVLRHGSVHKDLLLKSLLPTVFENNWYITCYLLFYPIHPLLNLIIRSIERKNLFRVSAALFSVYCCINIIYDKCFFPSNILLWIVIYFVMAYLHMYMREFCDSVKGNVWLFLFGFISAVVLGLGTNAIGLIIPSASASVLHWVKNCNPFLLAMVISSFNLMRRLDFKNKTINYISGLTLLIYIIHENIILRSYYRPWIWRYVYLNFGYENLVLCTLCIAVVIFLFGTIASIIYDKTLRKAVASLSDKLYALLRGNYLKFENKALSK